MHARRLAVLLPTLAVLLSALPAAAQSTQPAVEPDTPQPSILQQWLSGSRATADWFGVRTASEDIGISFLPVLITGYQRNLSGGVNTHNANDFPGNAQYNLEVDFNKMGLVPGGSFFIRGLQSWHDGIRADTGSIGHPFHVWGSSGDAEILADKWWWRRRLLDDRIELRLGKLLNIIDLFDTNAYAANMFAQFSNAALAANGTLPVTRGIGAFVKVWPTDWLYIQAAAIDPDQRQTRTGFDTAFHGPCHFRGFWEVGLTPKFRTPRGILPGNYRFGWWYDTQRKSVFRKRYDNLLPERFETGDMGGYLSFDQMIWKESDAPKDRQGLGAFFRYGWADEDVNRVSRFWSAGVQYEGLISGRDRDVLGIGVAQHILSSELRHKVDRLADRETIAEMYYAIQVTPWMVITPDVQLIGNPGGRRGAHDAIVGGVRIRVTF